MDEMASDVLDYLTRNQLDGFDLDWEFPVWGKDARSTDKFGFTVLLDVCAYSF
jgi:GH18 family chitinase